MHYSQVLDIFLLIKNTPINIGIKERSCHEVGEVLKIIHAKKSVIKGPRELNALALVTGIRWIPSTHSIVDSPKIKMPFIIKKGSE